MVATVAAARCAASPCHFSCPKKEESNNGRHVSDTYARVILKEKKKNSSNQPVRPTQLSAPHSWYFDFNFLGSEQMGAAVVFEKLQAKELPNHRHKVIIIS